MDRHLAGSETVLGGERADLGIALRSVVRDGVELALEGGDGGGFVVTGRGASPVLLLVAAARRLELGAGATRLLRPRWTGASDATDSGRRYAFSVR
jgi:hypothetical protein